MRIKANQNLYKNILIAFNGLIIFVGSLGYFLGFTINANSLLFYGIFLISTIILFFIIFLVVDKCNKKYIVFDEAKIKEESKYGEKVIVYYNQILYTKYHNSIDLFNGIIDFGFVKIVYKTDSKDKESKYIHLYLSKKNYKKYLKKGDRGRWCVLQNEMNIIAPTGDTLPLAMRFAYAFVSKLPRFRLTSELNSRRSLEGGSKRQGTPTKNPNRVRLRFLLARPGRFELSTYRFVAGHSIR